MTLPYQELNSLNSARDFLNRLQNPYVEGGLKRIPSAVRREAREILRHYPFEVVLEERYPEVPDEIG